MLELEIPATAEGAVAVGEEHETEASKNAFASPLTSNIDVPPMKIAWPDNPAAIAGGLIDVTLAGTTNYRKE